MRARRKDQSALAFGLNQREAENSGTRASTAARSGEFASPRLTRMRPLAAELPDLVELRRAAPIRPEETARELACVTPVRAFVVES